jgi:branched-chain amino acid transport system ATP-binding protein
MPTDILVLDDVVKRFGSLEAVSGLSLSVHEDEVLSVIGPNGAGKTTTFNLITGLFEPSNGTIELDGEVINGKPPYEIVERGLVRSFQITQLFEGLSVLENVRLATQVCSGKSGLSRFLGHYIDDAAPIEEARAVLEKLGMADVADEKVGELSHGEQRHLELGIALACDPSIICMDEPTAGMSAAETEEMIELIGRVAEDTTVLIVEHDMDVVMRISDRIAVMNQGQLVAIDDPESIRQNQTVQEAYLGTTVT